MARARPNQPASQQQDQDLDPQDAVDESPDVAFAEEKITDLGAPRVESLFSNPDAVRRLPSPEREPVMKGDVTAKNRREREHELASARALGGEPFAALERNVARAKAALVDAPDGADLVALQKAYRLAKEELDKESARLGEEARKRAKVRRYRVFDNNAGKGRLASTPGSAGRAKLNPGKEIDSLNYDVEALKKQGVKLEEIVDDEAAA